MPRPILLCVVVVLALVLVPAATPTLSSPPGGGALATNVNQAFATFWVVDSCTAQELWVQFTAGMVRDPLGGRPGPFSDVVVELRVFDTCNEQELLFLDGTAYDVDPNWSCSPGTSTSCTTSRSTIGAAITGSR